MRVLVCPDSFTGTLSAAEATDAIIEGWARTAPNDELIGRPLSDGGPGFVAAIEAGLGGERRSLEVTGPLGEPVTAEYLLTGAGPAQTHPGPENPNDRTAWIESASAAGIHLVPADRRDPARTTSLGVGQLIADAITCGASRVVVGVGGTGTSDGGAGLLAGLGASCSTGELTAGGAALAGVAGLDLGPALAATSAVRLEVATDVDVPLLGPRGAARGFAPQKGAGPEQVEQLEEALRHWAHHLGRTEAGLSPTVAFGAGAGGGIGSALIRLGARRVAGIATVLAASGVEALLAAEPREADLVVTGEGSFDWQSLQGKVVTGVASAALVHAVPVLVLAGRVEVTRREWITAGIAAAFPAAAADDQTAAQGLAMAAERAARTWSGATRADARTLPGQTGTPH